MKHVKLAEYARRALVALLTITMLFTSMPMAAIAEALPQAVPEESGDVGVDGPSEDTWSTSVGSVQDATRAQSAPEQASTQDQDDRDHGAQPQPADEAEAEDAPAQNPSEPSAEGQAAAGAEEAVDARELDRAKLTEAPELTEQEALDLLPDLVDSGSASKGDERANEPSAGDGTTIEHTTVEWITPGSANGHLTVRPATDDPQDVRMRMNVAFSGQRDYEPGTMRLTVPKSIFAYRDGSAAGTMTTSVPEAPDTRALFSYMELDDTYVLTNTRKLTAATSAMFEFTVRDIIPHLMDGSATVNSDPFWVTANVTTHDGHLLGKTSNEIDATFDTSELVKTAESSVELLTEAWDDSWPAELKPSNPDGYVYADFYSWATVGGNQDFKMEVTHSASVPGKSGVRLLGMRDQDGRVHKVSSGSSASWVLRESGYTENDTRDFFVHAYVAVPKNQVPSGGKYPFKDEVTYKLTSTDDKQVSTESGRSEQVYAPLAFVNPGGHFNVFKSGSIPHKEDGNTYEWGEPDPLALNDLREGHDVLSTWRVETLSFNAPWTAPNGKPENMEQLKVKTITDDTSVQFNHGNRDLTAADFEFASIRLSKPEVYRYQKFTQNAYGWSENTKDGYVVWQKIPAGTYGYMPVPEASKVPDVEVWGKINDGGDWQHLATVCWTSGSPQLVYAARGASLSGDTVAFPKGTNVTDLRTVFNTERSGIIFYAYPTVRLKATPAIKQQVERLYANSSSPSTAIRNKAVMSAYAADGRKIMTSQVKAADNKLSGASVGVRAHKKIKVHNATQDDKANRLARFTYTVTVHEQSNLTTREQYQKAIDRKIFKPETSGVFYDLLPARVVPDMKSIKLREGDSLKNAYTVENYKGSGRTLLVVEAGLRPHLTYKTANKSITGEAGYCDTPQFSFDAVYSWEDLTDLGADLNNVVAFESGNASLGNMKGLSGEPDDPLAGKNETSSAAVEGVESLMTDLNPNRDDPSFVYANCHETVAVDVDALTGLTKRVAVNSDGVYGQGLGDYPLNVYEGGSYSYRLRIQNSDRTKLKDVILYDDLENYKPERSDSDKAQDAGDRQWRGVLQGIDLSSLKAQGVDPVVYYSTKSELDLETEGDVAADGTLSGDLDISNSAIWSTAAPADRSQITGVAIDCRKTTSGEDFVLETNRSMGAVLNMRAPYVKDLDTSANASKWYDGDLEPGQTEAGDNGLLGGAHAYNNVARVGQEVSAVTGAKSAHKLVKEYYTKVGLRNSAIAIKKIWKDGGDQDGKRPAGVTIHLTANGKPTQHTATLSDENGWSATFEVPPVDQEGHTIHYGVQEDSVAGYTYSLSWVDGTTDADPLLGNLTNMHDPEKTEVTGIKTWEDANDAAGRRPDSIKLDLYANGKKVKSQTVRADAEGNWTYKFTNLDKFCNHGDPIKYEVREDTYYAGYVPSVNGNDILNTYDPFGDLKISKKVLGALPAAEGAQFDFRLELTTEAGKPDSGQYDYEIVNDDAPAAPVASGKVSNGGTITLKGGQTAIVRRIPSESEYRITEKGAPGFALTGRVEDSGTIQAGRASHAKFTNVYSSNGSVRLEAKKSLSGRKLNAYQFRFNLLDAQGNVIRTASNDSEGRVLFGALRYSERDLGPDGTAALDYTIEEQVLENNPNGAYVIDSTKHGVRVALADNGKGAIEAKVTYDSGATPPEFNNTYTAHGEMVLRAWKELKSGDLADYPDAFTFRLKDSRGVQIGADKHNDANGVIKFDPIAFDQDDAGKTFTYTAEEVPGSDGRLQYDDAKFTYTVRVVDNGDGTLSFEQTSNNRSPVFQNTLTPGNLRIEKRIQSGDPTEEFTFHVKLTAEQGQELPSGKVEFDRVQLADGSTRDGASAKKKGSAAEAGEGLDSPSVDGVIADKAGGAVKSAEDAPASDSGAASAPGARASVVKSGKAHGGTEYANAATWTLYSDGSMTVDNGVIQRVTAIGNCKDWIDPSVAGQVQTITFSNTDVRTPSGLVEKFVNLKNVAGVMRLSDKGNDSVVQDGEMKGLFQGTEKTLKTVNLEIALDSGLTDAHGLLSSFKELESVRIVCGKNSIDNFSYMFYNCPKLHSVDLSGFDMSSASNLFSMFRGCVSLAEVKFCDTQTCSPRDMSYLFDGCEALAGIDLSTFNPTAAADMYSCFPNRTNGPCSITLGSGWRFNGSSMFPEAGNGDPAYSGKWAREDMPDKGYTPEQLRDMWTGSTPGTFVWQLAQKDYTVRFDANAPVNEVSGSMADQTWKLGEYGTIPSCAYRRFNHRFTGWNTRQDGSGTPYSENEQLHSDLAGAAGETVTLYAQWEKLDNTININNGEFDITIHGGEAAIIKNLPAGVGYVVTEKTPVGWVLVSQSGESGAIKPNETVTAKFLNNQDTTTTSASIVATKFLDGAPAKAGYSFELYEMGEGTNQFNKHVETVSNVDGGGISFSPITYSTPGLHHYMIKEVFGSDPNIEYDTHCEHVAVNVTGSPWYGLTADVVYERYNSPEFAGDTTPDAAVFNNTTEKGALAVTKQVVGKPAGNAAARKFQFRVDWNGGKTSSTFALSAGETKTFDNLVPGTTYTVTELGVPNGFVQTGATGTSDTIVAAHTSEAVVTNTYAAQGSAIVQAKKELVGAALHDGQFQFELFDSAGVKLGAATNGADGTVTFDPIAYTEPGTYSYTIREVRGADPSIEYSHTEHKVTVVATDKGDGSLETKVTYGADSSTTPPVFTNISKPGGTIHLSKTVVNGTDATAQVDFTFTVKLMDINGKELAGDYGFTKSDGSTGSIKSGGSLALKGGQSVDIKVPLGTTYEIVEAKAPGFESASQNSTGSVPSANRADVQFTNTYSASGSFVPQASKRLDGGSLREGQFSFKLLAEDGTLIQTVRNAQDGSVKFAPIDYTLDDVGKTFTYRMQEVDDGQANIEYDAREIMVRVTVRDKGDGTLDVAATYDDQPGATFVNKYRVRMPETGRAGIAVGVGIGLAVMGLSAYELVRRKKR